MVPGPGQGGAEWQTILQSLMDGVNPVGGHQIPNIVIREEKHGERIEIGESNCCLRSLLHTVLSIIICLTGVYFW